MIINTPIQIPEETLEGIRDVFLQIAIESYSKVSSGIVDLPIYAHKSEVKKALGVGEKKLNIWISEGLKLTSFGGDDYRIAKKDLINFFDNRKI